MIKISDIWTWEEWKQIFDKQRKEMKMKICHCIKITPQELDALETACNVVKTIAEDDMCSSAF